MTCLPTLHLAVSELQLVHHSAVPQWDDEMISLQVCFINYFARPQCSFCWIGLVLSMAIGKTCNNCDPCVTCMAGSKSYCRGQLVCTCACLSLNLPPVRLLLFSEQMVSTRVNGWKHHGCRRDCSWDNSLSTLCPLYRQIDVGTNARA